MRLKLTLKTEPGSLLTPNYNYQLSSAIYKLLQFGSPSFSKFLHDIGFKLHNKRYKLFTYALRFKEMNMLDGMMQIKDPSAYLYISSPLIDDFIKNVLIGTFEEQRIKIIDNTNATNFIIKMVEIMPEPKFSNIEKFILLSPSLVTSTRKEHNGKLGQYYYRAEEIDGINRVLNNNLRAKYEAIYGQKLDDECFVKFKWSEEYLRRKKNIQKKVTIKENGEHPIGVIGNLAPFSLEGSPILMKVGYQCGFGQNNSVGFGMVEVIRK